MVTGTVTFMFTDIEGSTQRWDRERDAMAAALRRHDGLVRDAIVGRGGEVFKTVGDAFCAVFATAPAAVAAALDAQRALQAGDFAAVGGAPVRMALHTGTAEERDGDYFGPNVNRVARLVAIGHGGQVLISSTTAELLLGEMPEGSILRDLGSHRLKDLARPEHVYQLDAADLPSVFPALRSLDELPNNLPPQLTSFVGREEDVAEIKSLLREHRLLTLFGSGGAGKTRCAIQAGAELLDAFADGVWLVELASISGAQPVARALAQSLGVRESPNEPFLDTLLAYMKQRRLLLLVDNCEHVIDDARTAVAAILRSCPGVRILATSRESLNIAGERVFRLPSLAVPPMREAATVRAALPYGAVALFADRAVASDARFTLTDKNVPYVMEISRRLDGIPLAIELAAARIKVLSPQQLAQKLDERFRVLTGGDRSALPRHQTMRALIDWSYDLLAEEERALFRKLAIFAGGFTLESASAVCGDETLDEFAVLERLTSLVDKSLVLAEPAGDATRYRLLESTRQYAREKLEESGAYDAVARAHAAAFLALAERLETEYATTSNSDWFAQVEPEVENWRAAVEWALTGEGDVLLGQRLAVALGREWAFLFAAEERRWLHAAQACVDDSTPVALMARLDLEEAQVDSMLGLHKASCDAALRALERCRALGDAFGIAQAQRHAGRGLAFTGRHGEGEVYLREALEAFRTLGARELTGATLENLGVARKAVGDVDGARRLFNEALAIFRSIGSERLSAAVATNLAEAEFRGGDPQRALALAQEALAYNRSGTLTHRAALLMCNMAAYLIALERYDEARSRAREAIAMARDAQYDVAKIWAMHHLIAAAALRAGDDAEQKREACTRGARLLGYVDARLRALESLREYTEQQEHERIKAALTATLGDAELRRLAEEGSKLREDEAIAEALQT